MKRIALAIIAALTLTPAAAKEPKTLIFYSHDTIAYKYPQDAIQYGRLIMQEDYAASRKFMLDKEFNGQAVRFKAGTTMIVDQDGFIGAMMMKCLRLKGQPDCFYAASVTLF